MEYYEFMSEKDVKFHRPAKLAVEGIGLDSNQFIDELTAATLALGEVQGSQKSLKNPALLIAPLSAKEAAISSKIEGTQSTVSDVFMFDATGKSSVQDTPFVINYRNAIYKATGELRKGRKLTPSLVEALHKVLLEGSRYKGELGKFREKSVWIATNANDPIEKAIYIPPRHMLVPEYMDNLFQYLDMGAENILIRTGLMHYQFEAVHPFEDGNGRIGRLLVPLILFEYAKLTQPILYMSGYLESHRDEYIDALHQVDITGKYEPWLKFYFSAMANQLTETQLLINSIFELYDQTKEALSTTKARYVMQFIDFIFRYPYFTIPMIQDEIKMQSRITAKDLVDAAKEKGFVRDSFIKDGKAKLYAFEPLLHLLR
jgi:Fic family protein